MSFNSRRLKEIRENLGISKAEAARRLNMTAMGYGRYENGQREPSFQTINYIAQVFGTSSDYLYDKVNNPSADVSPGLICNNSANLSITCCEPFT